MNYYSHFNYATFNKMIYTRQLLKMTIHIYFDIHVITITHSAIHANNMY